jgi:isochorismate synthase
VRVVVRPPEGGTFIAATPERLVRRDGATVACDALAGSVARGAAFTDDAPGRSPTGADDRATELLASGKDRREHDLVVSAIGTALRELGADVRVPTEPTIRTLRHVLHLHTPIAATLREPHHVLELAAALHPTPAVGGTPTRIATEWIAARESVPRGWYASPVGWFDLDGNGELAVAIRSGLVTGDRAHLWAGAGIVAGSDPDRELAETDLKLRAILGALGVSA